MSRDCPGCGRQFKDDAVDPIRCRCGTTFDVGGVIASRPKMDQAERKPRIATQQKLGDWTEEHLKRIGVTPERYAAAKEMFGLSPTCNCEQRKQWLNKVSDWWRGQSTEDQG